MTVRLLPAINEHLERLAEDTGIPKASLILFAIHHICLHNMPVALPDNVSAPSVRFSLRMPDHVKKNVVEHAKAREMSTNTFINAAIFHVSTVWWNK